MTKRRKKNKLKVGRIIVILILISITCGYLYYNSRPKLQVVSVIERIDEYNYYLEDNATKIYKDNYKKLKSELKNSEINEENYAKLISKLFVIDYYTLNNKITNKDIGGVQFIHSSLKDKFITEASETIYKYVKNDLYGKRKQDLPEVKDVEIKSIKEIRYRSKDLEDAKGFELELSVKYKKDYGYPDKVGLRIIHEDNKLSIVEIG